MKSYSLILHGAVTPGPEAREALKVALHSILHFESAQLDAVFTHLPSAIREGLTLEEAQKLQFSIESFDGDVELLEVESASIATNPDADEPIIPPAMLSAHKPTATDGDLTLAPAESEDITLDGDNSWDDQPPITKEAAPELEFNLDLGEPGAMSNQKPPAPPPSAKSEDLSDSDLSFEFGESEAAPVEEIKSEAPKFVPPSVAGLRFENEPEPVIPEPSATVVEPDPVDIDFREEESEQPSEPAAPQLSDAEIAARAFKPKQASEEDSAEAPPEEDWHKVQVDWTPSGSQSAVRNRPNKTLQLIFGGVIALGAIGAGAFLLSGDDGQKITLTLPVDQLLKDQENILRPKASVADKKRGVETVPFEKLWLSEKTLGNEKNRVALRLEVGRTSLGFGIHEVEFTGEAPPGLTKQEYLRGDRLQPWLRRFEAFQRVLGANAVAKTENDPNRFSASIGSKIFVEEAEQPSNFPGEFFVKAQYDSERDVVVGEWRLTNVDLPEQFSDTSLVRKTATGYEVIFKGDFTASAVAPTPTPAPRVESTPEVASEAEEEEEAPKKPKGKKPKSAEGGKPGSSLMDD